MTKDSGSSNYKHADCDRAIIEERLNDACEGCRNHPVGSSKSVTCEKCGKEIIGTQEMNKDGTFHIMCANPVGAKDPDTESPSRAKKGLSRTLAQIAPENDTSELDKEIDRLVEEDCRQDIDSKGDDCNIVTELFIMDLKALVAAETTKARIDELNRLHLRGHVASRMSVYNDKPVAEFDRPDWIIIDTPSFYCYASTIPERLTQLEESL